MWVWWVTGITMFFVAIVASWAAADKQSDIHAIDVVGITAAAGAIVGMFAGAVWFVHYLSTQPPDPVYTVEYPLHEIKMGSETDSSGWFLVIAGGYDEDEELKYYFYVEHPTNGTLQLQKEDAEHITFRQEPTTKPRIVCKTKEKSDLKDAYEDAWSRYDCVFHVPEGSISNDIDLEIPK
jgi:hypothetical protein